MSNQDDSGFLLDLMDSLLDLGDLVTDSLFPQQLSLWFCLVIWSMVFGSTIGLKRRFLRPYLEKKAKANFVYKVRLRKRRLRETLNDPVLVSDLKRRIRGTPDQVSQAIDRLRTMSEQEVDNDDDCSRGQEKKEAGSTIMFGTVLVALLVGALNYVHVMMGTTIGTTPTIVSRYQSPGSDFEEPPEISTMVQSFFFVLVQLGDSYLLYKNAVGKPKRRSVSRSIDKGGDDLLEPLLSTSEQINNPQDQHETI